MTPSSRKQPMGQEPPSADECVHLISEAMYWMTEHACTGEPAMCWLVVRKLSEIQRLPRERIPLPLRQCQEQLLARWADLAHAYAELERDDDGAPTTH